MTEISNFRLERAELEVVRPPEEKADADSASLRASTAQLARSLAWIPGQRESRDLGHRCEVLTKAFQPLLAALESDAEKTVSTDFQSLRDNILLLRGELGEICATFKLPHKIPQVRTSDGAIVSRIAALAESFLGAAQYRYEEPFFTAYIQAFQEVTVLKVAELWLLIPAMRLVLLEQIARRGGHLLEDPSISDDTQDLVRSLQEIRQTSWKTVIEPLILFDQVLRDDPAGAYAGMDYESRELYRQKLVNIADHSDCTEVQVAERILALARAAHERANEDPRVTQRASHVGNYLLAEATGVLEQKVGFNPPFGQRLRTWLQRHPDDFYLLGIALLTVAIVSLAVLLLTVPSTPLELILFSLLAVLIPSSQSAVQIMNYLATLLLPAQILPKLDFSEGLPDNCATLVAIPTMLLNEKQVRKLADALEVRYLGNQDPNLHFALLTDLPDSPSEPLEDNPLVDLAAELIQRLNKKYAKPGMGSFFLLHRHRVYNVRERLWMGWERKRGKLMDLNNLLRGQFDSFPTKVGNLSALFGVRYVITLDSDTELPRGSARRMVGALAHPLNQAIIDREKGIVVAGYGILQPRVGVSVRSTARSRLATIYSGQTGFDIYTHATSDVYQDLYGEGTFVGKGIYEVQALHQVLHGRFPRNALLSHDLMEGAYARAGLVSDIEVIEDYPSHYSAHNRRKHRWLRGDWQITEWLLPKVPDESRKLVPNPLSNVSRWKILDNLRRSLLEPALFLLFVLGWTSLPGNSSHWTLAIIIILFLPALVQLGYEMARAIALMSRPAAVGAFNSFVNASIANLLMVTFLAHQALLSLDAVVRTMVRRLITRQRLLEWETAAEAELAGDKRTMLDIYLNWTPAVAFGLFVLVALTHRIALPAAFPILLLWACSQPISVWLDRPPRAPRKRASGSSQWMLRTAALRIWRYYAEFSTEEHHWLVPDNVEEEGTKAAPRISPTNLGFLLNARQVACEFGYLTVPEFAQQTLRTLATVSQLRRYRGHLLNWYDTRSLAALSPAVVSSVDNGNFVASLWTLQQGCLQLLDEPLLQPQLPEGLLDHLYLTASLGVLPRRKFSTLEKGLRGGNWLQYLETLGEGALQEIHPKIANAKHAAEASWFQEQAEERIRKVRQTVQDYAPWLLPEFAALKDNPGFHLNQAVDGAALERIPYFIDNLALQLQSGASPTTAGESNDRYQQLLALLPGARARVVDLVSDLKQIAEQAARLAEEMDFSFLLNPRRNLISVAYEVDKQQLVSACYDLLASEARTAYLVAIAKDEIPQESWFLLGRAPVEDQGMVGLLSWTGTMFEYLMPTVWTRIYPNTLLERATTLVVHVQRAYAQDKRVPWGISESACSGRDDAGSYQYFPFGVPQLAIHQETQLGPVISPYSTFLALNIDPASALQNLREMQHKRWLGAYGFYEALDFSPLRGRTRGRHPEVVRCWMAHHQGMSLLSIANYLRGEVVQRWFHSHPRVQATELLLQEKPAAHSNSQKPKAKVA
ncbi:MAG: glycosyl transferase [Acidobacteriia bacterium]|nr:glycosyl transferase [Terriglobia bacterium]